MDKVKEIVSLASGKAFIAPMLSLILLTCIVWFVLYYKRLGTIKREKINAEKFKTDEGKRLLAGPGNWPAENYNHLFEMPVIFYAVCLLFVVTGQGDTMTVNLAWAYVALRVVHSIIHCTYNKIMHRFAVFSLSSLVMFAMVYKAWMLLV